MPERQIIEADLTWTGAGFEPDVNVVVGSNGLIESVGRSDVSPTQRLSGRALLPGMVNAHSHAFQRGLRGRGERFPCGMGSFWSWREEMYGLVESMDENRIFELSHQAFSEMLAAGITTVGEFHYLHHDDSGSGYVFDEIILEAARHAGIRLVLLSAFYETGDINQPLTGGQQRFNTLTLNDYWEQIDRLQSVIDPALQSLGVVAHSIRAVSLESLAGLYGESQNRNMVFHMHVEEQQREIDSSIEHYQQTPMRVLLDHLAVDSNFTAVHCTHTKPEDMIAFLNAGGNVCICPLTEANLGDGVCDVAGILASGGPICLGTDSNARISMLEEMRWLEYVQRLTQETRGVCADNSGNVARTLFGCATFHGAHALGIEAGRIAEHHAADFFSIHLNHPSLSGWTQEHLLESLIFGAGDDVIHDVCVGGNWLHIADRSTREE